jgi:DNA-binding transcriptional LysR family regulator
MDKLKAIEVFVRIVSTGSLSKAALDLQISRAHASVQLRQLESFLGVRLLNRTTRQISLTEAGADYFAFCKKALSHFDDYEADFTQKQKEPRGRLKVLAPMAFGNLYIAPAATRFTKKYPDISTYLILADTSLSSVQLIEQGYDLAIWMQSIEDTSIICSRLGGVKWRLLASPIYFQNHARPQKISDLADHQCLVHRSMAPDSCWRFETPTGQASIKVSGPLYTNSVFSLQSAALDGLGIALLPDYCVRDDLTSGRLEPVLADVAAPIRPIYALYPHGRHLPLKTRLFIDDLKDYLRNNLFEVAPRQLNL